MNEGISKLTRPFYLANVLAIAKADGHVQLRESEALRAIVRRIGATEQDVTEAAEWLASGRYQMRMPELPSERMANIQDMILVALAHGEVAPGEAAPIEQAAKRLGFAQTDMDMVVRRAEQELRKIEANKGRPGEQPPASPAPANRAPAPLRPQPVPVAGKIAPPKPPRAKPPPPPRPAPDPVPATVAEKPVPASPSQPEAGMPGDPAAVTPPPNDATPALSRRVKACMACRAASDEPVSYCFGLPDGAVNVWGCRLAAMDWAPGAAWFSLGAFRDDETFVFDKQTIADRLSANLSGVLGCPHLHVDYTEKVFDALPARVSVRGHWQYRQAESGDPDAVTVHVTRYIHGCPLATQEEVSGIEPVGTRGAEKLIRGAMKTSGRHDLDRRRLRRTAL